MVHGRPATLGERAERLARRFLIGKGLRPVAENFRCRLGEIDLVMVDGDYLVFVEVRYRSARRITSARNTVDIHKRRKLIRTAAMFLASDARFAQSVTRFDVIGVESNADGSLSVEWTRDAFRPTDASL